MKLRWHMGQNATFELIDEEQGEILATLRWEVAKLLAEKWGMTISDVMLLLTP